jgi:hypothetical protein
MSGEPGSPLYWAIHRPSPAYEVVSLLSQKSTLQYSRTFLPPALPLRYLIAESFSAPETPVSSQSTARISSRRAAMWSRK